MKGIVYIHYGSTVFDSSKGFPIRNEANWSKPRGGLWASRQNSTFGWKTWCEQEEFRDCDEHNSFKFRLCDNAKVAVIHNMKDLRCLPTIKSSTWVATEQADFLAWYNQMKDQLGEDAAGNLQNQINKDEIKRILLVGFEDGTKEFSEDGTVITSTASDGRILTKTFTNGFLTMTSVLKSAAGAEVARAVKTFNADGSLISTVVTYS